MSNYWLAQEREVAMQRKSVATKKSAALSIPKAKAVSWSTDDVYNLLKAVNEITLKRMEDRMNE